MKKIKTTVSMLVTVALLGALGGCSTTDKKVDDSANNGDKPYIAVVSKGFQHQFWQVVKKGADKAAEDLGVKITFEGPPSESDINAQVNMINGALAKKPVALALAVLDTKSVASQLSDAQSKKIPVIGFDSGIPGALEGQVAATASTDNAKAAALAAQKMIENKDLAAKIKAATKETPAIIGVLSQDATSASIVDRTKGYIDEMKAKCEAIVGKGNVDVSGQDSYKFPATGEAKVKIVVKVPPTTSATDIQNAAQSILGTAGIVGLYGSNQGAIDGILAASSDGKDFDRTSGKYKDIVVVGFDAGKGQKTAVANGWFMGSITQDPYQIGYDAVALAVKASKGEKVANKDTGAKWYTSENMNADDIKDLLYD